MIDLCSTCVHRKAEEITDGLVGFSCENECTGVLQQDDQAQYVTDCEDYKMDDKEYYDG